MPEYVMIGTTPVEIPPHLTAAQREQLHRGHPDYRAPSAAECPDAVAKQGPAAVAAWVDARKVLPALTQDELENPEARAARLAAAAATPAPAAEPVTDEEN